MRRVRDYDVNDLRDVFFLHVGPSMRALKIVQIP